MTWEKNIFGMLPSDEWLNVGFNVTRPSDPIDGLFGDEKTDNLVAKWQTIASEYQIPVMAQFHGFDTEAQTTFRVPVDTHNIEKGLIKVKINQSERLRALVRSGVQENALFDYVINDGIRLADQVFTRTKVAKNELMAYGQVTINENNLSLTVDYGVPAQNKSFSIDLSEDADVDAQIQTIIDAALEQGVILNGMLTSRKIISRLRQNKQLQKAINGNIGAGALISRSALENHMAEEFGLTRIITNDLTYGDSATIGPDDRPVISTRRYFPDSKITFFATNPAGRMGVGLWGNPPEVDASTFYKVNTSTVNPYVYVMQWMETDPAVLWTKASGLFMPVLYNPNSIFIASVGDDYFDKLTVEPENQGTSMWNVPVSSLQGSDVTITGDKITGTIKYLSGSNAITDVWGPGNFLALKWSDPAAAATSLKVGLEPSAGSGMVEAIDDNDRNGIFKISSKNTQKLKLVVSNNQHATVQTYDLSGLTVQSAS